MDEVLDAWAVVAYLRDEPVAATRVERSLVDRPAMSWINLGEVYYILHRAHGAEEATATIRDLRPWLRLDLPTETRVLQAAALKAEYRMSYADAFAAATAVARNATLLTGDPELLVSDAPWRTEDITR